MKSSSTRNLFLAATAAGMLTTCPAIADTQLTIDYAQTYQGNVLLVGASGSLGSAGGEATYLSALQATYAGGDAHSLPSANPFNTFCFDIGQTLLTSGSWQATTLPTGPNGNTIPYVNGGLQRAAIIYNAYAGGVDIYTPQGQLNGGALQLAIWNDLYDGDNSVSKGVFSVNGGNSAGLVSLADSILQSGANVANPNLAVTCWEATDNQDLISLQAENGFVPEPGTYAAAAFACAYLGLQGIRRKQMRS
jgi:hypothetical protein